MWITKRDGINGALNVLLLLTLLFFISCQRDISGIEKLTDDNFWRFSSPEAQGLNSQTLDNAFDEAEQSEFMDCLLVIKNGYIVAEKYYNGYDKYSAHNIKSVSKSFLSAITGIALHKGYIGSIEMKMLEFFAEYDSPVLDERKRDITIRHLLTMRAGWQHEYYNYMQLYSAPNWIKTTIELPLTYDPGSTFAYNTFETHLLSAILTKSSGMSTKELMEQGLLDFMEIKMESWERGPDGYYFGGNSMYIKPRDMAKLGYLYLKGGNLYGKQIIPASWVDESLTAYTGFSGRDWGTLKNYNYGYLWWLGEINSIPLFLAIGYGGQFVIVVPERDMIIVTTAESALNWEEADAHEQSILNIVGRFIIVP